MKVLVACEESQEVCKAFREKGHKAFSCDILPCLGGHPEWHLLGDVRALVSFVDNLKSSLYSGDIYSYIKKCDERSLVSKAFDWSETDEGSYYWDIIHEQWTQTIDNKDKI